MGREKKPQKAVCDTCEEEFIPHEVAETTCVHCRHEVLELPDDRYIAFLERMVVRLIAGLELQYYDDTTIGSKETHCSWGTCSHDLAAWPAAGDHLWPDQFLDSERVSPKYHKLRHFCPFDRRIVDHYTGSRLRAAGSPDGCFFRCMIFNPKAPRPTREEAILLYKAQIVRATKGG